MLKGVIFDMDGVLIDSHPIHKRAWRKFFASLGLDVSESELDFVLDGRKKEDILRHFLGDLPDSAIRDYGHRKEMLFREEALAIATIDGALEFLEQLGDAGIAFALASCGSHSRVHYILRRLNIHDHFAAIVTADDVQHGKPHPEIFQKAAGKLGRSCCEILVIEDAVSGVKAARAAGMKCIGIADPQRAEELMQAGAERVLPNFLKTSVEDVSVLFA